MHAEISAMHYVPKQLLQGADMVVIRIGKGGALLNSKPCVTCRYTMKKKGIRRVYYSTNEGLIELEYLQR